MKISHEIEGISHDMKEKSSQTQKKIKKNITEKKILFYLLEREEKKFLQFFLQKNFCFVKKHKKKMIRFFFF